LATYWNGVLIIKERILGMADSNVRSVVVFESAQIQQLRTRSSAEEFIRVSKNIVDLIRREVEKHGGKTVSNPVPGEGGWTWHVRIKAQEFGVFLHWAPIGNPPRDSWVVQTGTRQSLFSAIFGRPAPETALVPIVERLRDVVNEDHGFSNIRWLTRDEFRMAY